MYVNSVSVSKEIGCKSLDITPKNVNFASMKIGISRWSSAKNIISSTKRGFSSSMRGKVLAGVEIMLNFASENKISNQL